jgi:hypothetical protein
MDPRERRQEEDAPEMDERLDDMTLEDEPIDPDDDDTLGRPVQLQP